MPLMHITPGYMYTQRNRYISNRNVEISLQIFLFDIIVFPRFSSA